MKFRPQMILRFRSLEQKTKAEEIAKAEHYSLNEWVLLQMEKSNPSLSEEEYKAPEPKKVKPKAKAAGSTAKVVCPYCETTKSTKPWGTGNRCDDCNRNF